MLRYGLKFALMMSLFFSTVLPVSAVEVYIFRGAGDFTFIADRLSFSEGMDKIGDKVRDSGIYAEVYRWENSSGALRNIRKRKPRSVALLGHSMGALAAINTASILHKEGVKVSYLGLIDIPGPVGSVPKGVMWAENFYSLFPVYGLLPKPKGHKAFISNKHVFGQIHTTMDNSRKVHDAMISAIWQIDDIDRGIREPVTLRAFADTNLQAKDSAVRSVNNIADAGSLQPTE